jgi:hypothetical protein
MIHIKAKIAHHGLIGLPHANVNIIALIAFSKAILSQFVLLSKFHVHVLAALNKQHTFFHLYI